MSARKKAAKSLLQKHGVKAAGKPVRTPNHPKKSHKVVYKGKLIRFGEQGAKTNRSAKQRKAFKSRHRKNIARGPTSPAYWANKVKWKA
tara:strand:+ start:294 stop:560 length:267 start_codon:yes stop_codon:yes gene_type:complete